MKKFFLIAFTIFLFGCGLSSENILPLSNTVKLGEVESSTISLSTVFAQQLAVAGFEFGNFATESKFLGWLPFQTTRIEILKNEIPLFTVFEFQLSPQDSYADIIQKIREKVDLKDAIFGEDSFYFLRNNLTTNILLLSEHILAFQFSPQNFEEIRDFISSLLILR
ncbi:hypothetical protein K9N08_00490 [Candidatus Gracilibacteria bacterium]|nr:hypothetical protein [Candidatus Gracilibacteria bacterium]MCF7856024.1 hypothetical protein [Candidatus Gracilibacteria bacterium]MCF7896421.1 hypothetical protein [Candidatus Gracilibacteria bacterium]